MTVSDIVAMAAVSVFLYGHNVYPDWWLILHFGMVLANQLLVYRVTSTAIGVDADEFVLAVIFATLGIVDELMIVFFD